MTGRVMGLVGRIGACSVLLLATGCSPLVRFEGRVALPGIDAPVAEQLHLRIRAVVESFNVEADPRVEEFEPDEPTPTRTVSGNAIDYGFGIGGAEMVVDIQFWYDGNGNGERDAGDRVGRLAAPVPGADRGPLRGNLNTIPPVTLTETPPGSSWPSWPESP